jgi:hypothetical protein
MVVINKDFHDVIMAYREVSSKLMLLTNSRDDIISKNHNDRRVDLYTKISTEYPDWSDEEVDNAVTHSISMTPITVEIDDKLMDLIQKAEALKNRHYNGIGRNILAVVKYWKNYPSYRGYWGLRGEVMVSLAHDYCTRNINKYDELTNNPYNYFSMVAKSAFNQQINKYKKEDENLFTFPLIENVDEHGGGDVDDSNRPLTWDEAAEVELEHKRVDEYREKMMKYIETGEDFDIEEIFPPDPTESENA